MDVDFCSLISALPGVGDAVGGALIAAKYTKIGCAVIKGSYVIGNVIRNNIERAINGEKFNPAQLAVDL